MPTETNIHRPQPRYEATVTHDGTTVKATIGAQGSRNDVLLQRGHGRSILRVDIDGWEAFAALVDEVSEALKTKAAIENPAVDPHLQVPVAPAQPDAPVVTDVAPEVVPPATRSVSA